MLEQMEPLLRDFFEYNNDNQNLLTKKMFSLYEDFEAEFKVVFGEVDKKRAVERQLAKFKQTGLASYYTVQFRQIILRLYQEDDIFITKFYKGLKEYIKHEIVKEDRSEELAKYIEYTVRIDNRLYKR